MSHHHILPEFCIRKFNNENNTENSLVYFKDQYDLKKQIRYVRSLTLNKNKKQVFYNLPNKKMDFDYFLSVKDGFSFKYLNKQDDHVETNIFKIDTDVCDFIYKDVQTEEELIKLTMFFLTVYLRFRWTNDLQAKHLKDIDDKLALFNDAGTLQTLNLLKGDMAFAKSMVNALNRITNQSSSKRIQILTFNSNKKFITGNNFLFDFKNKGVFGGIYQGFAVGFAISDNKFLVLKDFDKSIHIKRQDDFIELVNLNTIINSNVIWGNIKPYKKYFKSFNFCIKVQSQQKNIPFGFRCQLRLPSIIKKKQKLVKNKPRKNSFRIVKSKFYKHHKKTYRFRLNKYIIKPRLRMLKTFKKLQKKINYATQPISFVKTFANEKFIFEQDISVLKKLKNHNPNNMNFYLTLYHDQNLSFVRGYGKAIPSILNIPFHYIEGLVSFRILEDPECSLRIGLIMSVYTDNRNKSVSCLYSDASQAIYTISPDRIKILTYDARDQNLVEELISKIDIAAPRTMLMIP